MWDACDKIENSLPRGNRSAMRRELYVWVRDCNESIEEFEGILSSSPRSDRGDEEDDGDGDGEGLEEETYAETEMSAARASVNVMKCSKNMLNLVLAACDCVGERADALSSSTDGGGDDDGATTMTREGVYRYITDLHEMARTVGEGVTDLVLLYPPLDFSSMTNGNEREIPDDDRDILPRLGRRDGGDSAAGIRLNLDTKP